jgi:glutathione peroxidase
MGFFASVFAFANRLRQKKIKEQPGSIYDFRAKGLSGAEIDFDQFRGKRLLIVNTASKCVYTPQLEQLQQLHEKYRGQVAVVGVPSNDFLWQEPGTSEEIENFCAINYGVNFLMLEKTSVTGRQPHPLFSWLAGKTGKYPTWNFCKYLVEPNGQTVEFFSSKIKPLDKQITEKFE